VATENIQKMYKDIAQVKRYTITNAGHLVTFFCKNEE